MKGKILVRRMLRSPQFMIGFFIVFGIVIVSVFARQLAPTRRSSDLGTYG